MIKNNWANNFAKEFRKRNNDTTPVWSSAICTSPVWDEEEEEYVGPFLAQAYDGQIVLDSTLVVGDVSTFHEGMTVYFTGNPFNGSKVLITNASGGGGGQTYEAGYGLELNGGVFSVDDEVIATKDDLDSKQDTLTAGTGITITNNTVARTNNFLGSNYTQASITDMNNLTTTRFSKIYANLTTVANAPADVINETAYYSLIVPPSYSSSRIAQILIYSPGSSYNIKIWVRSKVSSTLWKDWVTVKFDTGGVDTHSYVSQDTDLNGITSAGSYILHSGTTSTNRPSDDFRGGVMNVEIITGVVKQYIYSQWSTVDLYYRERNGSTWSAWSAPNGYNTNWDDDIPLYTLYEEG